MKNRSDVSLIKCATYDTGAVARALKQALEPFGGMGAFTGEGQKVLLKPNLLLAAAPDKATTTHPSVVEAVIRAVQATGAEVWFGDLPGGFHIGTTRKIYQRTGMKDVAERTGAHLAFLEQSGFRQRKIPNGKKLHAIHTPKLMDDMDVLINLPKVKTHMQSLYTGAIKNLFGFMTTRDRMNAHHCSRYTAFSEALVDIFSSMQPDLNIMDGIVGMEGTGPSQGKPVRLNMLMASTDAVAMDTVAGAVMGLKQGEVLQVKYAAERGLGCDDLKKIKIHGATIRQLKKKVKRPSRAAFTLLPLVGDLFQEITKVKPRIDTEKCRQCRHCVEVCPADAINTDGDFIINDNQCILCFCCHEMCEYSAIYLKKTLFVHLLEKTFPR